MGKDGPGPLLATILMLALILAGGLVYVPGRAYASPGVIIQTHSGLVASDPLTSGSTTQWFFGGDAASQPGAKYSHSEDQGGLHVSVEPAASGTWSGYYAVSPDTSAYLFHAFVTLAYTSVPDNGFNTGIYVQTANNDFIDYVGCLAVAVPQGYYWTVVQAYGVIVGSQAINTLYDSPMNTGPLAQDCTIITNGNNYLKVYIGGAVVVDRTNMTLNIPPPFQVYLEPQSSTATSILTGTYTNYYATQSENVKVTNAPPGGKAEIVSAATNGILATAPIASNGTASLRVGMYELPLSANIEIFDAGNNLVSTTSGPVSVWGGDVYKASTTTTSSSTISSTTTTTTSSTSTDTAGTVALASVRSTSGTTSTPPYQFTIGSFDASTGSDRLLLVGVSANSQNVASVTFGGISLSRAVISFYNNDAEFWYLVNPTGTGDIVVTMGGPTSAVIGAYAFTGADQLDPLPTVASNHNTLASSPTVSITTKYSNSWIVDLPSIFGGSTLGSSTCTPQWDINVPNEITGASSTSMRASPGTASCAWTATPTDLWDSVAVEIKAVQ